MANILMVCIESDNDSGDITNIPPFKVLFFPGNYNFFCGLKILQLEASRLVLRMDERI